MGREREVKFFVQEHLLGWMRVTETLHVPGNLDITDDITVYLKNMTKIVSRKTIKGKLIGSFRKSKSALYFLPKMPCSLNIKSSSKLET